MPVLIMKMKHGHYLNLANSHLPWSCQIQHPPHFAIESTNAEAFGKLTKHRDGTASVYIEDPFGNAVEIIEIE